MLTVVTCNRRSLVHSRCKAKTRHIGLSSITSALRSTINPLRAPICIPQSQATDRLYLTGKMHPANLPYPEKATDRGGRQTSSGKTLGSLLETKLLHHTLRLHLQP